MKDWEKATEKFLEKWKDKDYVVGAIVCGSHVIGNPTDHSDIDLRIILSDDINWRQRGNEIIDGFLIEYFMNPVKQDKRYIEQDFLRRRKMDVHMYTTGKVLFDKTGEVKEMIKFAKKYDKKSFPKATTFQKNISRYALWDMQDNLEEVYERGKNDFYYVYYNLLDNIFFHYCQYLGYNEVQVYKVRRFLTEKKDRIKYKVSDFPDNSFVKMFLKCIKLEEKDVMLKEYQKLTKYVLEQMNWEGIDGWKLKSNIDKDLM